LLSLFLGVRVKGTAAFGLVHTHEKEITRLLLEIPTDLDLVDLLGIKRMASRPWPLSGRRGSPLRNRTLICSSLHSRPPALPGCLPIMVSADPRSDAHNHPKPWMRLEAGDVLTVWKLDRLGRNTRHVLQIMEDMRERVAGFRSLTEGLDTAGPMGTAVLTITAAFAQLGRDTMIERTRAGPAAAAANNRHGGSPGKVDDAAAARAKELKGKGISASDIGKMLGVSCATIYRCLL
jgi:hypothetical protein